MFMDIDLYVHNLIFYVYHVYGSLPTYVYISLYVLIWVKKLANPRGDQD